MILINSAMSTKTEQVDDNLTKIAWTTKLVDLKGENKIFLLLHRFASTVSVSCTYSRINQSTNLKQDPIQFKIYLFLAGAKESWLEDESDSRRGVLNFAKHRPSNVWVSINASQKSILQSWVLQSVLNGLQRTVSLSN